VPSLLRFEQFLFNSNKSFYICHFSLLLNLRFSVCVRLPVYKSARQVSSIRSVLLLFLSVFLSYPHFPFFCVSLSLPPSPSFVLCTSEWDLCSCRPIRFFTLKHRSWKLIDNNKTKKCENIIFIKLFPFFSFKF